MSLLKNPTINFFLTPISWFVWIVEKKKKTPLKIEPIRNTSIFFGYERVCKYWNCVRLHKELYPPKKKTHNKLLPLTRRSCVLFPGPSPSLSFFFFNTRDPFQYLIESPQREVYMFSMLSVIIMDDLRNFGKEGGI